MRQNFQVTARTGVVPDALVVARDDLEPVFSGRQSAIMGHPVLSGLNPVCVESDQPVFETYLRIINETEGGKVEGQFTATGRYLV